MVEFFSKIPVSHLGHDAVIEIMIALLGVMIAVLTLVAALLAVAIAVVGVFGYQTIRDEAAKRAATAADETARKVTNEYLFRWAADGQASGLSESQSEPAKERQVLAQPKKGAQSKPRRKATSDHNLKEGAE